MIDKQEAVKAKQTIARYCQEQHQDCSECIFAHWYEGGSGDCFFDLYPHPSDWKVKPKLQVGDIIFVLLNKGRINKIVVGLVVVSDKRASDLNGVMYNLEGLTILTIKRMNNTNERVEVLWRADND